MNSLVLFWLPKRACSHLGIVATICINMQGALWATLHRVFLRSERPRFSARKRKARVRLSAKASSCLLSIGRHRFKLNMERQNKKQVMWPAFCFGSPCWAQNHRLRMKWVVKYNLNYRKLCCLRSKQQVVRRHMKSERKSRPLKRSALSLAPPLKTK